MPDEPKSDHNVDEQTDPPLMIPTRGGRRASDDPAAPGFKPSTTLTWLKELMAGKKKEEPELKPSKSDISTAGPSQFLNATSRLETGQHERSEASLINPLESSPTDPVESPALAESVIEPEYRFPTEVTHLSLPTTHTGLSASSAVPSLPSQLSIATSHGISLATRPSMATSHGISETQSEQDPDETVSLSYFANPIRSYRSDADLAQDDDSIDIAFEGFAWNAEDSPNDLNSVVYTASHDSLSILEQEIAESRRARAQQATDQAERFQEAQEAADEEPAGPSVDLPTQPRRAINFNLSPAEPEPEKWTKGLTRGLSRLFGREPRSTPDLETGRIPYAAKGKGRADPPIQLRPSNPLNAIKRFSRPPTRDSFIDLHSDHGSPRLSTVTGVTRKLSFRRPAPTALEMSPEIKRDPFAKDLYPLDEEAVLPTVMPPRTSIYTKLAMRRPSSRDPKRSKAEQILGTNLDTYKPAQSYPDLLMPQPRPHPNARPTSFAGLPAISHPFAMTRHFEPVPKAKRQENAIGKWFRGITRPQTAQGFDFGPRLPQAKYTTRKASVTSHESVAQRLERMVSRASSQLEPGSPPHTGASIAPTLYPDGIDPIADPELYALVRQWQMHRRNEDERRLHDSQREREEFITANAFPMPPSPPPRQSSLPTPGLLSPNWTPTPMSPPLVVPEGTVAPLSTYSPLRPVEERIVERDIGEQDRTTQPLPLNPTHRHEVTKESSSPEFEPLAAIHPSPPPSVPNALGLSTSSSRVSFAPSPPRHSHIDLKDFLLSSPSQLLRTTSAAELHRPNDGPLIPDFPTTYDDIDHLIVYEMDVWRRIDEHWNTTEMDILWQSLHPRYSWKQYRLVLTSAQRRMNYEEDPADIIMQVFIHLFAIRDEATPWRSHTVKFNGGSASVYSPEITRRKVYPTTTVSTFQPYTVKGWKEVDGQLDITRIDENGEHPWFLELKNLHEHVEFAHFLNTERDCLIAGAHGCGTAFRHRITHTSHTPSQRSRILAEEIAAASARWDTRRLALEDDTPPPSPIRPAPRLPVVTPSKSILKKRASTGDLSKKVSPFGPYSSIQGYIHELDAWQKANDLANAFRDEQRVREESERTLRGASTAGPSTAGQPTVMNEITPALTDISLPSEGEVQSPPNAVTILPPSIRAPNVNTRRRPKPRPSTRPSTLHRSASPDSPGRMRSSEYNPAGEDFSALMTDAYDWLDGLVDPDYPFGDEPGPSSSPLPYPPPALPTEPITPHAPQPSDFVHLQPSTNTDVPRYGRSWPCETHTAYTSTGPLKRRPSPELIFQAMKRPPTTVEPRWENGVPVPLTAHMSEINDDWKYQNPVVPPPVREIEGISKEAARVMYEDAVRKVDRAAIQVLVDRDMPGSIAAQERDALAKKMAENGADKGPEVVVEDTAGKSKGKRLMAKQKGKGRENVPPSVPEAPWEDNNPMANFNALYNAQPVPHAMPFVEYVPSTPTPGGQNPIPFADTNMFADMHAALHSFKPASAPVPTSKRGARKNADASTSAPLTTTLPLAPRPPRTPVEASKMLKDSSEYAKLPNPDPELLAYHNRQMGMVHMTILKNVKKEKEKMQLQATVEEGLKGNIQNLADAVQTIKAATAYEKLLNPDPVELACHRQDVARAYMTIREHYNKRKEKEELEAKEAGMKGIQNTLEGLARNAEEVKKIRSTPTVPVSTPMRILPPVPLFNAPVNTLPVVALQDQVGSGTEEQSSQDDEIKEVEDVLVPSPAAVAPIPVPLASDSPSTRFLINSTPHLIKQAQSVFTQQTPNLITPDQSFTTVPVPVESTPSRPSRSKQKREDEDLTVSKRTSSRLGKGNSRGKENQEDVGVRSNMIEKAKGKGKKAE